jgi:hypothetical protein
MASTGTNPSTGQPAVAAPVPSQRDRDEAIRTLELLVVELPLSGHHVEGVTMRARHAYMQLGWQAGADYFNRELSGYGTDQPVPPYRSVDSRRVWETGNNLAAMDQVRRPDPRLREVVASYELRTGLSYLAQTVDQGSGLRLTTGRTQVVSYTWAGVTESATWAEQILIDWPIVRYMLQRYASVIHLEIGSAVIAQRAGTEATGLWEILRVDAEQLAAASGVGQDLRSIVQAALSANPSEWQGALLRCRNVIDKLSRHLYQAPEATYPYIPDRTGKEPMRVDADHYRNRLTAYMQQKLVGRKSRELADSHLLWFIGFVDQANQLGTLGKGEVRQRDVANGLMHTYLLLSEIATRTDGKPLTTLVDPSAP